ncbi:MAG: hypothetical protein AB7E36_02520 [Salinivirgaceae bacterium]
MIKQIYPLFMLLTLLFNSLAGQEISSISTTTKGEQIIIDYTLSYARFYQTFNTSVYVSFDGGSSFQGPLKAISGDVGEVSKQGKHTIVWNPFEEYNALDGPIVFDVRSVITEKKRTRNFFVNYSPNILLTNTNYQALYGIQLGQIGKTGWFLAARVSNFSQAAYKYDGETITPESETLTYKEFTGKINYPRYMITGGLTFQMNWNSFFYLGGGYGYTKVNWEFNEYEYTINTPINKEWAEITSYNTESIEAELGFIFKARHMTFMFGVTANNHEQAGITAGIGINF